MRRYVMRWLTEVAAPERDSGSYRGGVRHTSGPLGPPWYWRRRWVVGVALVLLVGVLGLLYQPFRDASGFRSRVNNNGPEYIIDGSSATVMGAALVVLLRPFVLRFVRLRVPVVAGASDEGGWRARAATAGLNAGYVLVLVGPGRWAVTTALTAYATRSARFPAPDEVVAQAAAVYVDRTTGLLLLVMALQGCVVHLAGRGRRRLGVRD